MRVACLPLLLLTKCHQVITNSLQDLYRFCIFNSYAHTEEMEKVYVDLSENAHCTMNKYFGPIRQFSLHTENAIQRIIKDTTGIIHCFLTFT